MTWQQRISVVADALTAIEGLPVYHYWRFIVDAPWCIWQEDGYAGFQADNKKGEMGATGTVDYFTKEEYDPNIDAIQNALNGVENLSWTFSEIQYEEDTNLIHVTWRWTLYG